jgi:hypothetical protein
VQVSSSEGREWKGFDMFIPPLRHQPNTLVLGVRDQREAFALRAAIDQDRHRRLLRRLHAYRPGALQKQRRLPSDTLIYDFQYRCQRRGRTSGFGISVSKLRTDRSSLSGERTAETVIVQGD